MALLPIYSFRMVSLKSIYFPSICNLAHHTGFVQAMEFWKNYGILKRKFHIWKNYGI